MFGLLVAGRPVDASPQAITGTQFAFKISATPSFQHIVVFLLPDTALPAGTAASVYIQIPPSQEFRFLGGIGPGKESAIFKINGMQSGSTIDLDAMSEESQGAASGDIIVGVSIEPGEQVDAQLTALKAQSGTAGSSTALVRAAPAMSSAVSTKQLAKNIIGNAFDFLASFGSDTVPLKAFQDWWTKFEKKIDLDPTFLERAREG
ncbi:hypothetical protein AMS68_005264 [Peltaster fructicola]|uniref:Uncharacterized protein n=1 Tax=Peltaster fructicola TaxID=286661 RepID=A0A6H0XY95_9PEZI|nr:hypothetical protein AMS68_005264 [Peltaster fructicola]